MYQYTKSSSLYINCSVIMCALMYGLTLADLLVGLLECFLIEQCASMSTDDKGHSSSFTMITGAVDDPHITDTTPTHKKVSHAASLAAEYEPGHAKTFAALCQIFSAQCCANPFLPFYLARFCHAITTGLKYNEQVTQYIMVG